MSKFLSFLAVFALVSCGRCMAVETSVDVFLNFDRCLANISLNSGVRGCNSANMCISIMFNEIEQFIQSEVELKVKVGITLGLDSFKHDCNFLYSESRHKVDPKALVSCQMRYISECLLLVSTGADVCGNMEVLNSCLGPDSVQCFNRIYSNLIRFLAKGVWDSNNCAFDAFAISLGKGVANAYSNDTPEVNLNPEIDPMYLEPNEEDDENYFGSSFVDAPATSPNFGSWANRDWEPEHDTGDHDDSLSDTGADAWPMADRSARHTNFDKRDPFDEPEMHPVGDVLKASKMTFDIANFSSLNKTHPRQSDFTNSSEHHLGEMLNSTAMAELEPAESVRPTRLMEDLLNSTAMAELESAESVRPPSNSTPHEMLPTVEVGSGGATRTPSSIVPPSVRPTSTGSRPPIDGRSHLLFCGTLVVLIFPILFNLM